MYENYYLKPGYIYVSKSPTVINTVLGSCVSICIFDKKNKFGGMNHFLMPRQMNADGKTTKYGDVSIREMFRTFIEFGADRNYLVGQIIGGGYFRESKESRKISEENARVGRELLGMLGIKIVFEDTGGTFGRKITFYTDTNRVIVTKIKNIRDFEYNGEEILYG